MRMNTVTMSSMVRRPGRMIVALLVMAACAAGWRTGAARADPGVDSVEGALPLSGGHGTPASGRVQSHGQEAGITVAAATVMAAPPPSVITFSDTVVTYRFQGPSVEPGLAVERPGGRKVGRKVPKTVINLFHVNAWAYGTNLLSLDILRSGSQDPAGGKFGPFEGVGATEIYLIYRGVLSPNRIFDTTAFAIPGVVKDIGLSFGADVNTKDTTFDSEKRAGTFGLNFAFDVPAGFVNLKVQGYKEFSRNGFAGTGVVRGFDDSHFRSVEFKMTPEFELTYAIPLPFTGLPLALAGFNAIVLPKGRYGRLNENDTQLEFVSQTNLVLDVGQLLDNTPNRVEAFLGFQYWHNKFGGDPRRTPNTEEKALIAGIAYHLK